MHKFYLSESFATITLSFALINRSSVCEKSLMIIQFLSLFEKDCQALNSFRAFPTVHIFLHGQ